MIDFLYDQKYDTDHGSDECRLAAELLVLGDRFDIYRLREHAFEQFEIAYQISALAEWQQLFGVIEFIYKDHIVALDPLKELICKFWKRDFVVYIKQEGIQPEY